MTGSGDAEPKGRPASASARSFRDLVAWQKAMDLVTLVYRATARFPCDEVFGLRMQMRRAAVSIPSNIAEGWGRQSRVDYARFLRIARGSLYELQTQTIVAARQGYISPAHEQELRQLADETGRVLYGLTKGLETQA